MCRYTCVKQEVSEKREEAEPWRVYERTHRPYVLVISTKLEDDRLVVTKDTCQLDKIVQTVLLDLQSAPTEHAAVWFASLESDHALGWE